MIHRLIPNFERDRAQGAICRVFNMQCRKNKKKKKRLNKGK